MVSIMQLASKRSEFLDGILRMTIPLSVIGWIAYAAAVGCSSVRYSLQQRKFGHLLLEDYIHIFALIQLTVFSTTAQFLEFSATTDPDEEYADTLIVNGAELITCVFYVSTIYTVKAMFLVFYRRLFNVCRAFRISWWLAVIFTAVTALVSLFSLLSECGDFNRLGGNWRTCRDSSHSRLANISVVQVVCNVSSDMLIIVLPIGMLRSMQTSRAKKYQLLPVFLVGFATVVTDILAWAFLNAGERTNYQGNIAFSNDIITANVFLAIEPPTAIIAACLPVLVFANCNASKRQAMDAEAQRNVVAGPITASIQNRWLRVGNRRRQESNAVLSQEQHANEG